MANSIGNETQLVPVCKGFDEICSPVAYEVVITIINAVALVINLLHLTTLRRITAASKGTKASASKAYPFLIQLISLVDMLCAIANVIKVNCILHRLLSLRPKQVGIALLILEDCILMFRYPLLVIACAERYVVLHHAMRPASIFFSRFCKLWCLLAFLIVLALYCTRALITATKFCIHPVVGVLANSTAGLCIFMLSVLVPVLIASIMIILSTREMRKMKRRASTTEDERYLQKSTTYVFIITATFYACFVPAIISVLVKIVGKIDTLYTAMVVNIVTSCYGITNTMIYGWKHERYRKELLKMFHPSKNIKETKVSSEGSNTESNSD
ncbi:mu-type opioid receptor-like [Watersipora subatra]|uniref:mu-type opioid receptor-like n=1 Tax=Watersipora subatra TaxID=2589382 RepID=UPI00355C6116